MLRVYTHHQKHATDFGDRFPKRWKAEANREKTILEFNNSPAWMPLFSIRVRRLLLRAELGPQELLLAEVESNEREIAF